MEKKEFKQYTPEQEEKIELLRKQAKLERFEKNKEKDKNLLYASRFRDVEIGDDCTVTMQGMTIIGKVTDKRVMKSGGIRYDVMTPLGPLINVTRYSVKRRFKKDLSHVKVPDELKKMSTSNLLGILDIMRKSRYEDDYSWVRFTEDEVKAELANRPHVPNKKEKKIIRKWQADRKKWLSKN